MANTKFLEPGGDADFLIGTTNGFWGSLGGTPAIATDFVHGTHIKSIKYRPANADLVNTADGVNSDAGSRISFYIYLVALPTATARIFRVLTSGGSQIIFLRITSAGVLQLRGGSNAIGSDGATLSTGIWYRISLAYTIIDASTNRFEFFVNGVSNISGTNVFVGNTGTSRLQIGNADADTTFDFRSSDHYVDDSSSLTDTGDIWVIAKRPNANGTTNGFTTQIGAGGSGYGSGHSPQVNERPLSTTNGWSMIGAGSAITEEYNIEGKATGDIDISTYTIIDYVGWVSAKSLVAETASIIVNGASSNISLTTGINVFTKIAGSSTYPAGTGADIGIVTDTSLTTVSLYETGIIVAATPPVPTTSTSSSTSTSTTSTSTSSSTSTTSTSTSRTTSTSTTSTSRTTSTSTSTTSTSSSTSTSTTSTSTSISTSTSTTSTSTSMTSTSTTQTQPYGFVIKDIAQISMNIGIALQ